LITISQYFYAQNNETNQLMFKKKIYSCLSKKLCYLYYAAT